MFRLILFFILLASLQACITSPSRPCTNGSLINRSAKEAGPRFKGFKKCYQAEDAEGRMVNHGQYYEYYENDRLALEGEFKMGKKHGHWIEYDENGKVTTDQYFQNGREVAPKEN